jgi:hypothetical protein
MYSALFDGVAFLFLSASSIKPAGSGAFCGAFAKSAETFTVLLSNTLAKGPTLQLLHNVHPRSWHFDSPVES